MTQAKNKAEQSSGLDRVLVGLLGVLPIHGLSRIVGKVAGSRLSRPLIPLFARHYGIDTGEGERPPEAYPSLLDYFIRKLRPGVRQIDTQKETVISPVDGMVGALGVISAGQAYQAKGVAYSLTDLLGGDQAAASAFEGGTFITIYLSPRDYHRIHMPFTARIVSSVYVPGTLFPVNSLGVRAVAGLFARNERLITYMFGSGGLAAVVKVGAAIVGSVKVVYDTAPARIRGGQIVKREYPGVPELGKGDELGWFEFGSTVVLLFQKGLFTVDGDLVSGQTVRMGMRLGELRQDS
ncbi:MAG TPA: archaetidylserine decarboxylase [Bacillota bacterium]|nr:archaetidylserine decarboxylase [Bacillota bacterium]